MKQAFGILHFTSIKQHLSIFGNSHPEYVLLKASDSDVYTVIFILFFSLLFPLWELKRPGPHGIEHTISQLCILPKSRQKNRQCTLVSQFQRSFLWRNASYLKWRQTKPRGCTIKAYRRGKMIELLFFSSPQSPLVHSCRF